MTSETPSAAAEQPASSDEKLWSTLVQLGGILFSFLPGLIVYLAMKDKGAFLRANAAAAFNFQIVITISFVIAQILSGILLFTALYFLGGLLIFAVWAVSVIFSILAAMKANQGEVFTYPFSLPILK